MVLKIYRSFPQFGCIALYKGLAQTLFVLSGSLVDPILIFLLVGNPYSHKGLDCILSRIKLIKLSFSTDNRAVVEGVSCPIKTDLDTLPADHQILNVITIGYDY